MQPRRARPRTGARPPAGSPAGCPDGKGASCTCRKAARPARTGAAPGGTGASSGAGREEDPGRLAQRPGRTRIGGARRGASRARRVAARRPGAGRAPSASASWRFRGARRLRHEQRRHRPGDAELLPLPRHLRALLGGDQQLQQAEPRQVHDLLSAAARRRPTASASSSSGGWPRTTPRSTSWASTSPGRPSSPRPAGSSRGPGRTRPQAEDGTLAPALETAIWNGQLFAVPDNTNTQLLWYRSDLVTTPPKTWAQMIADAEQLAKEGKPHYIEIQGAQYEGATVWFNTMVASAGGTILNPAATKVTLGAPAVKALSIMKQLATSPAADPSLGGADGEPEPAGDGGGHGGLRAELPVRVSVDEGRQPEAVQALQVGALPARSSPACRPR